MFDEILNTVREHIGGIPEVQQHVPAEKQEDLHREIATQVDSHLSPQAATGSEGGGMFSGLSGMLSNGGTLTNLMEGGLIGSLTSKFGLSPAVSGAIAASLPGLIQKFLNRKGSPA